MANGNICGTLTEKIPVHLPLLQTIFPTLAQHDMIIVAEASTEELKTILNIAQSGLSYVGTDSLKDSIRHLSRLGIDHKNLAIDSPLHHSSHWIQPYPRIHSHKCLLATKTIDMTKIFQ